MAIQFFEAGSANPGELLFAGDYLQQYPKENGKKFVVREVVLAQSGKGYMLYTEACIGWLYKRNPIALLLTQALEVYVRDRYGYAIILVLDNSAKDKIKLGVDPEIPTTWFGTGKKYTVTPDIPTFDVETGNPFLIPHAPSTPTTQEDTNSSNNTKTSHQKSGKTP